MKFPNDCYSGYVTAIFDSLSEQSSFIDIGENKVFDLIKKFMNRTDRSILIAISWLIQKHSAINWPNDILTSLCNNAVSNQDPENNEYLFTDDSNTQDSTVESMLSVAYNSVRGCAVIALSTLLADHKDLIPLFEQTIVKICDDHNAAVRYVAVSCVYSLFDIKKTDAIILFKKLIELDSRILVSPECWSLIHEDYLNESNYYLDVISSACHSKIKKVSATAARLLCALAIYFNDDKASQKMYVLSNNKEQVNEICSQAIYSFNNNKYHQLRRLPQDVWVKSSE